MELRRLKPLALLLALSCSDTTGAPFGPTRVLLTDAPFPFAGVARVDLHILDVSIASGAGPYLVLVKPQRAYDLVALLNGRTADLGAGVLPPGRYDRVLVTVDMGQSSITLTDGTVLTGRTTPGLRWAGGQDQIPAGAWIEGPIELTEDGGTLVVDINLAYSFRPVDPLRPKAGFEFAPGARAIDAIGTGSLSGIVRAADGAPVRDASVTVSRGNSPALVTRTDPAGQFRFAFLRPGVYSVFVEPPLESPYGYARQASIRVTASAEANAGTLFAPLLDASEVPGTYVARFLGPDEYGYRSVPTVISPPGPTMVWLDADTLMLDGSGNGTEVRVERTVTVGEPAVVRTTRLAFTYTRTGRILTIHYPCPTGGCPPPPRGVVSGRLTVYWPEGGPQGIGWPREFERVGP